MSITGLRRIVAAAAFFVASLPLAPGAALAQRPVVDGMKGPGRRFTVPRSLPRLSARNLMDRGVYSIDPIVRTPALDVQRLMAEDEDAGSGPLRMGVVQNVLVQSDRDGEWHDLPGGGRLWTASFEAAGARGVQLRVEPWNPPPGAEFSVFPEDGGPGIGPLYRGLPARRESFWTPTVYSSRVHVEYYLPPTVDPDRSFVVHITGVLNQYRGIDSAQLLGCHLDVTCYPSWASERDGVGILSRTSNQYAFFCSGGLLNRVPEDYSPLFLTANHCFNSTSTGTALVTWLYQTSTCNGTPPSPSTLAQTIVETVVSEDGTPGTDTALLGLQALPYGLYFLGWDGNYWNGGDATAIHHPGGNWKRISFGSKVGDDYCPDRTVYKVEFDETVNGTVELGSSGSMLFDTLHRVRGALSCVGAFDCVGTASAGYGRFDTAFNVYSPFLDPVDPIYVDGAFGGTETGTMAQPFDTIVEAGYAVIGGSNVFIQAGSYPETFRLDRPMTLNAVGGAVTLGQ